MTPPLSAGKPASFKKASILIDSPNSRMCTVTGEVQRHENCRDGRRAERKGNPRDAIAHYKVRMTFVPADRGYGA
jgi:hypothetical protein